MFAFGLWLVLSIAFILLGFYCCFSKHAKAFGFWANAKVFEVEEEMVRSYNKALGRLWIVFGVLLVPIGLPLVSGQNSPLILLSVVGTMFLAIGAMIYYVLVIEKKYRKK